MWLASFSSSSNGVSLEARRVPSLAYAWSAVLPLT